MMDEIHLAEQYDHFSRISYLLPSYCTERYVTRHRIPCEIADVNEVLHVWNRSTEYGFDVDIIIECVQRIRSHD